MVLKKYSTLLVLSLLFINLPILGEGFVAGTLIKTPDGYMAIEQLRKGDFVVSYNFYNKSLTHSKIILIRKRNTSSVIQLTSGTHILNASLNHKFYHSVSKNNWISAKKLQKNLLYLTITYSQL